MRAVVPVACALFISACGGGGGGAGDTSTPAITLNSSKVTATFVAGTSTPLSIGATVTHVTGTLYAKVTDHSGVLQPTATLTPGGGESYTVGLTTAPALPAGHYTDSFQVSFCYDAGCAQPVAGSPVSVQFDFTVLATYTLTPSTLSAAFTAGSPPSLTVTVTPITPFSGPVYLSLSDPGNVLSAARAVSANSDGSYSITVQPANSLAAGHLTGTFSLSLCSDSTCASPLAGGSALLVPYDFTIGAAPPALVLSPASAGGTFTAGDPVPFLINLSPTLAAGLSFPVYVNVNDSSGTLLGTAKLASEAANHYTLTLQANPTLAAGHYTGSFHLNVCHDQDCTQPVTGSPLLVPFDIQIQTKPNAGLTPLTPWAGVGDWETFQRNAAHTGFVPVTLDPAVFETRWLWTAPDKQVSTLTSAAGRLYVNAAHVTYALNEFDHSVAWQYDFGPLILSPGGAAGALNPPAVSGGKVFETTSIQLATWMYAFDAANGTSIFAHPFASQAEHYLAPTVDSGVVFNDGGYFGGIYAWDATGTQLFFTQLQQFDEWTPAVDADYAYAYAGSALNLIDRHSGALVAAISDTTFQWHGYSMFSAAVLGQPGSVFAVNVGNPNANALLDFDTNARSIRWQVAGAYTGNPAYAAPVLYAVNSSPYRLEARSESDGTLLWSWVPQLWSETRFVGDVLVTNNLVFLSTNTATYAISQSTHQPVWSIPIPGRLALSASGVLYVVAVDEAGKTNGNVFAINVKS